MARSHCDTPKQKVMAMTPYRTTMRLYYPLHDAIWRHWSVHAMTPKFGVQMASLVSKGFLKHLVTTLKESIHLVVSVSYTHLTLPTILRV